MAQTFFYDEQIRRFLLQFIRAFSNFQVEFGKDRNGVATLQTVPVKYGDSNRMVSSILRENSENKIIPSPMISCYITSMEYNRERVQDPTFVDKKHIRQRKFNQNTGTYDIQQGNAFTVERLMPVPYTLTLNVDIWTSNTNQKLQLLEQILVLFNPALEIQSTDNYLDWTSLSYIELSNTQWSSKTVPQGNEDMLDIATLTFTVPIWITPPSKVKKMGVINKIVASIYDNTGTVSSGIFDNDMLMGTRMKFTPMNYGVLLLGNIITIIDYNETTTNKLNSSPLNDPPEKIGTNDVSWRAIINQYGELQSGISQIRLEQGSAEIVGTVAYHPSNDFQMIFTVSADTIPTNDLAAVSKIINPLKSAPGHGLPLPAAGQRYLTLNNIGNSSNTDGPDAWKNANGTDFIANANDIIEYTGVMWQVVFNSTVESTVHYVTNSHTGIQYKWSGTEWIKSYEGEYKAGDWSVVI